MPVIIKPATGRIVLLGDLRGAFIRGRMLTFRVNLKIIHTNADVSPLQDCPQHFVKALAVSWFPIIHLREERKEVRGSRAKLTLSYKFSIKSAYDISIKGRVS